MMIVSGADQITVASGGDTARLIGRHLPPPLRVNPDQITMLLAGTECDITPMRAELGVDPASIAEAYTR